MSAPAVAEMTPAEKKAAIAAELVVQRALFEKLALEWNEHFRKQGIAADALRICGAYIVRLEAAA